MENNRIVEASYKMTNPKTGEVNYTTVKHESVIAFGVTTDKKVADNKRAIESQTVCLGKGLEPEVFSSLFTENIYDLMKQENRTIPEMIYILIKTSDELHRIATELLPEDGGIEEFVKKRNESMSTEDSLKELKDLMRLLEYVKTH